MIYRSNKYLQIKELSVDQKYVWSADRRIVYRSKFDLHIEELSADQRIICRLTFDLQFKELSTEVIKEVSAGRRIICWSNNCMEMGKLSADGIILCRSFDLQAAVLSEDNCFICRSNLMYSFFKKQVIISTSLKSDNSSELKFINDPCRLTFNRRNI